MDIDSLVAQGIALIRRNDHAAALLCFERVLAARPDHLGALLNSGVALGSLERYQDALACFDRALLASPNHAEATRNRGVAISRLALDHYRRGRYQTANRLLADALRAEPGNPLLWNLAGSIAEALDQPGEAERCWRQAIALAPSFAEAHYNLGALLLRHNRVADAVAAFRRTLVHAPRHFPALNNLGAALQIQDQLDEALQCFEQAIAFNPNYAKAHHNRGLLLRILGRIEEAARAIEESIALASNPEKPGFYAALANSRQFTSGDVYLRAMEELSQNAAGLSADGRMHLHFALGKAYGDIGEYERSFQQLRDGNALKRRQTPYDEAATLANFECIRNAFSPALMSARKAAGHPSAKPIFILGMLRSGSSLVEQIMASHPQVHGAGECMEFSSLAEAARLPDGSLLLPDGIAALPAEAQYRLGETYQERLQSRAPLAAHITDKTLRNFLHVGLIHLALPGAKIIHVQRDPVDTCLSCFSHLFNGNVPYTYDLAELGRYWRAYSQLMAHWRNVLPPGVMLEIRYEDLVNDLEGQSRRLLAHCGLEWNDACLAFHKTHRPVHTASVTQVREPIYRRSLQKWRPYGEFLQPLLDTLSEPGVNQLLDDRRIQQPAPHEKRQDSRRRPSS